MKNTLASVQSIASQTLRTAPSPAAFAESFEARLMALSRAHEMLTKQAWGRADLHDIVATAFEPFGGLEGPRFTVRGPAMDISPETAVALHMTLHELVVNAAKYGALSRPAGHVVVDWAIEDAGTKPELVLRWIERGGPPITHAPDREGFGSRLIKRGLARDLGGSATMAFEPEGLGFTLRAPLSTRVAQA